MIKSVLGDVRICLEICLLGSATTEEDRGLLVGGNIYQTETYKGMMKLDFKVFLFIFEYALRGRA